MLYSTINSSLHIDLFSLRYACDFKVNIHNVYRRNFRGKGARKTIGITWWVLIAIIRVVHRWATIMCLDRKRGLSWRFENHNECCTIEVPIIDTLIYFHWDMHFILKWIFMTFTIGTSKGKEQEKPSNLVQYSSCSLL